MCGNLHLWYHRIQTRRHVTIRWSKSYLYSKINWTLEFRDVGLNIENAVEAGAGTRMVISWSACDTIVRSESGGFTRLS